MPHTWVDRLDEEDYSGRVAGYCMAGTSAATWWLYTQYWTQQDLLSTLLH